MWLHDLVCEPTSPANAGAHAGAATNEARSAELAGQLLAAAGLPQATVDKVRRRWARARDSSSGCGIHARCTL